jgi:hypothetical protein
MVRYRCCYCGENINAVELPLDKVKFSPHAWERDLIDEPGPQPCPGGGLLIDLDEKPPFDAGFRVIKEGDWENF